jgi:hypothetical protein
MNESYKGNKKFITDFEKCMGIIEDKNWLQKFKKWKIVKRRVISGWRNVILLGMLLRFLCIDYKKNVFWGKVYARYKRHLQNRLA